LAVSTVRTVRAASETFDDSIVKDRPLKYTRASQKCRELDFFGEFQELSVNNRSGLKFYC